VKDDKEKVQQLIKEAGYDFTEEELKSAKSELSDEDLDNVAGGYFMMIGGNT
jgi:predicted ribosomally synthesized peptide with nif11-like leader